jgi:hypothetical protein
MVKLWQGLGLAALTGVSANVPDLSTSSAVIQLHLSIHIFAPIDEISAFIYFIL